MNRPDRRERENPERQDRRGRDPVVLQAIKARLIRRKLSLVEQVHDHREANLMESELLRAMRREGDQ